MISIVEDLRHCQDVDFVFHMLAGKLPILSGPSQATRLWRRILLSGVWRGLRHVLQLWQLRRWWTRRGNWRGRLHTKYDSYYHHHHDNHDNDVKSKDNQKTLLLHYEVILTLLLPFESPLNLGIFQPFWPDLNWPVWWHCLTASFRSLKTRQIEFLGNFVNVARFARIVEWDYFCDFQTPWLTKADDNNHPNASQALHARPYEKYSATDDYSQSGLVQDSGTRFGRDYPSFFHSARSWRLR